jgi:hypothetical protein
MNYKNSAISEIENMALAFPNYTLGQIMLAIITRKPEGITLRRWLYIVSDEDLYTEIERTKLIETEE